MKRVILSSRKSGKAVRASYAVGDVVQYDSNWMGVNPHIGTGKIVAIGKGFGTHGAQNPERIYTIRSENGKTFKLDEGAIIGLEE